jgi:hypothetical protein
MQNQISDPAFFCLIYTYIKKKSGLLPASCDESSDAITEEETGMLPGVSKEKVILLKK